MYCLEIQGLFKTNSQIQGLNFNTAQTLEREGGMVVRPHKFLRGKQQITSAHDCHYPVIFLCSFPVSKTRGVSTSLWENIGNKLKINHL